MAKGLNHLLDERIGHHSQSDRLCQLIKTVAEHHLQNRRPKFHSKMWRPFMDILTSYIALSSSPYKSFQSLFLFMLPRYGRLIQLHSKYREQQSNRSRGPRQEHIWREAIQKAMKATGSTEPKVIWDYFETNPVIVQDANKQLRSYKIYRDADDIDSEIEKEKLWCKTLEYRDVFDLEDDKVQREPVEHQDKGITYKRFQNLVSKIKKTQLD